MYVYRIDLTVPIYLNEKGKSKYAMQIVVCTYAVTRRHILVN